LKVLMTEMINIPYEKSDYSAQNDVSVGKPAQAKKTQDATEFHNLE